MCGIAGIYGLEHLDKGSELLQRMTDRLAHRGPDASGAYVGKNCLLGHRRLSIIDLSESANQPWVSSDGRYALVFNGELYNYRELRKELTEYPFTTQSDTEVVFAGLIQWGMAALQKFNGMFALGFWDNQEEKLWLVRDRIGIKPLYYARTGQSLVFASEIRSILASGLVPRTLNAKALGDYLRYQTVHGPDTLVEGIQSLDAAHYLEISDADESIVPYWKPWQEGHADEDPIQIRHSIRKRLTAAVDRRLVSDVPFGAFLSGGIDSSLIVGIISQELGKSIDTFNVSFDESEFSEANYARSVAKRFQTSHHEILLKPSDFLDSLPDAMSALDHPSGDGPNTWIVSRETKRQGITMALSGLGGDELFAGYDVFKRIPYIADRGWILSFPKGLRRMVGGMMESYRPGMASSKTKEILTADYFDLEHLYPIFRKVLLEDQADQVTSVPLGRNRVGQLVRDWETYPDFNQLPTLSRIGIAEMSTYMQHVLLRDTDQMSMSHALEVRVPFLDHELVEYVMHVSDPMKYPTSPKRLLHESFADVLPEEIVHRKKMGFVMPWEHWMKNELREFCTQKLERLSGHSVFKEEGVEHLWEQFLKGDPKVSWSRIWPLVTLADWMEENHIE